MKGKILLDDSYITELTETEDKTYGGKIGYNGKGYEFRVQYPDTYTLDESHGNNGYLLE